MKQTPIKNVRILPHEIFALVADAASVEQRVKILQENATFELKTILQGAFQRDIEFDIPEGAPPYTPDKGPAGKQVQHISKAIRVLVHCVTSSPRRKEQKQSIFIKLLETVHADDAIILIAMKDRQIGIPRGPYAKMSETTVRKAFPNLLKDLEPED